MNKCPDEFLGSVLRSVAKKMPDTQLPMFVKCVEEQYTKCSKLTKKELEKEIKSAELL